MKIGKAEGGRVMARAGEGLGFELTPCQCQSDPSPQTVSPGRGIAPEMQSHAKCTAIAKLMRDEAGGAFSWVARTATTGDRGALTLLT